MHNKHRKKIIAPIVITGITVGFLVSAYRFIFNSSKHSVLDPDQSKATAANTPNTAASDPQSQPKSEPRMDDEDAR